ncbi:D-arabinono-1,4-lactone oxidase [Streptomyces sp. NPDC047002]|uniref:D-arabinono-1,4-lactone oxidase n=1 Tax=Streptomyces sp. NPDC047002 TaxID=3155475 RepID=UPI003451755F
MRPTPGATPAASRANWAGNIVFRAARLHTPATVEALRATVAAGDRVRVLGSGHSFNALADTTGDLVSVAGLPATVDIDAEARAAEVSGGLRFAGFTAALHRAGLALHNLGSLPHISLAGACATGTHGSGAGNGSIATAVRALELVTADGSSLTLERGDEGFDGAVVSLGALGVVTRATLDLVPSFDVRQWVYEGLRGAVLRERFDEVLTAAYSVSLFTRWRADEIEQVWLKQRVGDPVPATEGTTGDAPGTWLGARLADGPRHPVPGMDPAHCTVQGGETGPWHERLPHFRAQFTPSNGDELQSEYFVAREDGPAAYEALRAVADRIAPVLQVGEIRAVAATGLWLDPAHGRDSVAFHFTWVQDLEAVTPALAAIEEALAPFAVRPHWGKVFLMGGDRLRELYPRFDDFRALAARLDPEGVFRNELTCDFFGWELGG